MQRKIRGIRRLSEPSVPDLFTCPFSQANGLLLVRANMEGLAAFAVACNVLQVIDSAVTAIGLCKQVYKHGASIDNLDLEQKSNLVAESSKSLLDSQHNLATAATRTESQLRDVAAKCLRTADDLQIELAKLKKDSTNGATDTIKKLFKTWSRKGSIEKMEQKMEKYQNILQTSVVTQMNREQAAFILDQQDRFDRLDGILQVFIQKLADGCTSLSDLIRKEENQTRLEITRNSMAVRDHFDARIGALSNDQTSELRRQHLLNSLKFPEMNSRRNNIEDAHEGTYKFAFEDKSRERKPWSSLPGFLRGPDKLYWIQGKPGSGKSTLMRLIDEDDRTREALSQWRPGQKILKLAFFFWLAGAPLQRSSKGLWCSLLHQLLSRDYRLIDQLQDQERGLDAKDSIEDWSPKELSKTFLLAIKLQSSPIFILLDGLDEFEQKEGAVEVVKHIKNLSTMPELKLLVSSRPEFDILHELQTTFGVIPQMKLQDLTRDDIKIYVKAYLQEAMDKSQLGRITEEKIEVLISLMVSKAEGVFIWVCYVLKSLIYGAKRCSTWGELLKHLERCPNEIQDLYSKMWRRLNDDEEMYREEAAIYFHMTINPPKGGENHRYKENTTSVFDLMLARNTDVQKRVLEIEESVPASELVRLCDDTVKRVAARCAGLLEIDEFESEEFVSGSKSDPEGYRKIWRYTRCTGVRLIHRSAYDFLISTSEGQRISSLFQPTPEESLLTNVRLNMVVLQTTGWESGYRIDDLEEDLEIPVDSFHGIGHAVPDDLVVASMQTIIMSYARARNLKRDDSTNSGWNFCITELNGYWRWINEKLFSVSRPMDIMGLAASWGVDAFIKSFAQQAGRGRKLRSEYADYLLLCAIGDIPKRWYAYGPTYWGLIEWLLDQKANLTQRQYLEVRNDNFLNDEAKYVQVLTTPLSSFFEQLMHRCTFRPDNLNQWISFGHRVIDPMVKGKESVIISIGRGIVYTLPFGLEHSGPPPRHDDTRILLELTCAGILANLAYDGPSDELAYESSDGIQKARFIQHKGIFYRPDDKASDLILSACSRYMRTTGKLWANIGQLIRHSDYEVCSFMWNDHIKVAVDKAIPQCKKMTTADVREWLVGNGWLAPEGYVYPVDFDHPFEEEQAE